MVNNKYLVREEANMEHLHREAEVNDDFVKLQIRNLKPPPVASAMIVPPKHCKGGRGEEADAKEGRLPPPQWKRNNNRGRRRLSKAIWLPVGGPYKRMFAIKLPGWY